MRTLCTILFATVVLTGWLARAQASGNTTPAGDLLVNLNTATTDELQRLPGIGPAKAELIIARRKAHPFRTVEELVRIKGIGRKMLLRLRPMVTVTEATRVGAVTKPSSAAPCECPAAEPGASR